jgi:hypothetical protein
LEIVLEGGIGGRSRRGRLRIGFNDRRMMKDLKDERYGGMKYRVAE